MCGEGIDRLFESVDEDRLRPPIADRVEQKGNTRYVVEVRMREEDVVDLSQFLEAQIPDTGARIDQDIIVDQKRRCAMAPADSAAAAQHSELHWANSGQRNDRSRPSG